MAPSLAEPPVCPPRVRAHARPKTPAEQCRAAARQPRQAPPERCRAATCFEGSPLPPCLGDEARKEWQRLSKELAELGLLTGLDRGLLAAYCQAHALWVEAVSSIERYGTMIKSPNGYPMQSPCVAVANKQVDIMVRIAAELCMTPSSRTRIRVGAKAPEDPFEAFPQHRG
jgi:P27 family predicted phage terminase small subunit